MSTLFKREKHFNNELAAAARDGDFDRVVTILESGVSPHTPNAAGARPMQLAARNNHIAIVRLLLDRGASPNCLIDGRVGGGSQESALISAAKNGNTEIMEVLIAHDALLDLPDINDQTALIWAVACDQVEAVKLLLSAGADPTFADKLGQTASDVAQDKGNKKMIALF